MGARAQQSAKLVIGFLHTASPGQYVGHLAAFRKGLSEMGSSRGQCEPLHPRFRFIRRTNHRFSTKDAAMIKDILVSLPVGQLSDSAVNYAVSVAGAFEAHLTGVAFVQEQFVPGTAYEATDFIATYRAGVEKAAKAAVTKFEDATRRAGVSSTSQKL